MVNRLVQMGAGETSLRDGGHEDGGHDDGAPADRPVVTAIEIHRVRVPMSAIARRAMDDSPTGLGMALEAEEPWEAGDFVFACLRDEDGIEGWGEVLVWLPETGVSPDQIASVIGGHLGRYVLGAPAADVGAVRARMDRNVTRNEVAKGVLDLAGHDLAARQIGRPVHDLIGGRRAERLALCALVPLADPATTAALCAGYVKGGYRSLRIKLGTSPEVDRDVVTAVRDAVGHDIRIRVDFNQAYRVPQAVRVLRYLADLGIDAAEQPLPIDDVLGMVEVQRRSDIPLFLHEGAFTSADWISLIELGGCGVLGINAERPGGLGRALPLIDYAAARGMGTIIHNQPLGLGIAELAHLAAARADVLGYAPEMAGDVMWSETLVHEPIRPVGGTIEVPAGPGFGVTVDRDALDRLAVAPVLELTVDHPVVPVPPS